MLPNAIHGSLPNELVNHSGMLLKHQNFDKSNGNWSWLERWMAARPWENRLMEERTW